MFVRLAAYELLCVVCIPRMEHSNRRISEFEHRRRRNPFLQTNTVANWQPSHFAAKNVKFVTDRSPPFYTRTASGTQKLVEFVMKRHEYVTFTFE